MAPGLLSTLLALVLWDAHYRFASAAPVVSGTAYGFATGTTGGGDAKPVYPKTTKELETYLGDAEPRVIVLNKEFTFLKAEGSTTEQGCRPPSKDQCLAKKNGFEAQDFIRANVIAPSKENGGCGVDETPTQVTYDKAAKTLIEIASDKTLVGEGLKGVLNGKGIHIFGSNVIVQNIHITNLNPHLVWGGDAITIRAKSGDAPKGVWIDHVKVSKVGRQMLVINFSGATGLTISNSDFDGRTKFSASCDGHHYWGFLLIGKRTELSLLGNYINHHSGRSPKVGGHDGEITVLYAANNFFNSNSGHAFDVVNAGYVLAEGNYFSKVKIPAQETSKHLFVPTSANDCKAVIGRACSMNVLKDSGPLKGCSGGEVSSQFASLKKYITSYKAGPATSFKEASKNFGVGKLGDAVSQPGALKTSGVAVSSSDASEGGEDVEDSVTQDDILTDSSSSDKSAPHNPSSGGPSPPGSDTSKSMDNTEASVSEEMTGSQSGSKSTGLSPGTVAPDHQPPVDAKKPVNGQDEHHDNSQAKDESHEDKSKSKDSEEGGVDFPSSDTSAGGEDMENSVMQDDILTGSSSFDKSASHIPSAGGPGPPGSDTSKSMDSTEAPVSEEKTGGQADKNADDDSEESDKEGSAGSSHLRKNEGDANAWQPDKKADDDPKESGKEGGDSSGNMQESGGDANAWQPEKISDDGPKESGKEGGDSSGNMQEKKGDANAWQPDKKADDDSEESGKEGGGGSGNMQESGGDSNGWQADTGGNSYWQGSGKEGDSSAPQANSVANSYWKAFGNDGGANSST